MYVYIKILYILFGCVGSFEVGSMIVVSGGVRPLEMLLGSLGGRPRTIGYDKTRRMGHETKYQPLGRATRHLLEQLAGFFCR